MDDEQLLLFDELAPMAHHSFDREPLNFQCFYTWLHCEPYEHTRPGWTFFDRDRARLEAR